MLIGVVGLGLIGGSMAKAFSALPDTEVLGSDRELLTLDYAQMTGAITGPLDKTRIPECDVIIIALYPEATIQFMKENASIISKKAMVFDCCGTKRTVCDACFKIAEENGITFVGAHPMAGTQYSGFKYSSQEMFNKAPMVIVPPRYDDIELLDRVSRFFKQIGFSKITVTTAEEHDKMIAFTSQMAHLVSNAYIKSPTALNHKGFSAGSYKDMTRVAWLNPEMWTQLFLENRDNLLFELDTFIDELNKYKEALENNNGNALYSLLYEGKLLKEKVDGK
jgi:prephenate dehydrogenase